MPRDVRPQSRDEHVVHLNGRTYSVYTEQQSGAIGYVIDRRSVRDTTSGDEGSAVPPEVAQAVIAKIEAHFQRLGMRYEIR